MKQPRTLETTLTALLVAAALAITTGTYLYLETWMIPITTHEPGAVDFETGNEDAGHQAGFQAGAAISVDYRTSHGYDTATCTTGPAWTTPDGRKGFLTAAHCANSKNATVHAVGGVSGTLTQVGAGEADAAFIEAPAAKRGDFLQNGTPVAGYTQLRTGQRLCVLGQTTGLTCGFEVNYENTTVPLVGGGRIQAGVASARGDCLKPGDSGGPVYTLSGQGATIVGIAVAYAKAPGLWALIPEKCVISITTLKQAQEELGGRPGYENQ